MRRSVVYCRTVGTAPLLTGRRGAAAWRGKRGAALGEDERAGSRDYLEAPRVVRHPPRKPILTHRLV